MRTAGGVVHVILVESSLFEYEGGRQAAFFCVKNSPCGVLARTVCWPCDAPSVRRAVRAVCCLYDALLNQSACIAYQMLTLKLSGRYMLSPGFTPNAS